MPPPKSGRITIIYRIGRMNAHRPRAPRKHSLRGWNPGGGVIACDDGGVGLIRVTRNQHPGIKFSSCENYIKFL